MFAPRRLLCAALGAALLAVVSTGCTGLGSWAKNGFKVGPEYGRPPAPVASKWIDAGQKGVRTESTGYAYWWCLFKDPVLNQLVDTASRQNLTLQTAGLRVLEARHIRGVATGNLFPQQQQAQGTYRRNKITTSNIPFNIPVGIQDHYDIWRGGFDMAWELDVWGKYRRLIQSADAALSARVEDYDNVLVILQAEVAANYILMRTYEERIRLATLNVDLQKETLRIVVARIPGIATELDRQQTLADLATTEAAIPVLRIEHRKAQSRLCVLLGMPPGELEAQLAQRLPIPDPPESVVVGMPAELLRRRPDVRRAERDAAAQSARIGVAEADFYPQFSIAGNIGLEARHFAKLWNSNSVVGSVGPGFRWNILNYGRIWHSVEAERAAFYQAVTQYQDTVLKANEEAENAIMAFLQLKDRVAFLQQSEQAAQQSFDLSKLLFTNGKADFQRVLDSQRALVQRQDNLAESRGNSAINMVAVFKAMGGGWESRLLPPPMIMMQLSPLPPVEPAAPRPPESVPAPPPAPQPAPAGPAGPAKPADGGAPGGAAATLPIPPPPTTPVGPPAPTALEAPTVSARLNVPQTPR